MSAHTLIHATDPSTYSRSDFPFLELPVIRIDLHYKQLLLVMIVKNALKLQKQVLTTLKKQLTNSETAKHFL